MTTRVKKGIGLIVSGVVSVVVGVVFVKFTSTPAWVGVGITCVTAAMSALNIYFVAPDTTVSEAKKRVEKLEARDKLKLAKKAN